MERLVRYSVREDLVFGIPEEPLVRPVRWRNLKKVGVGKLAMIGSDAFSCPDL